MPAREPFVGSSLPYILSRAPAGLGIAALLNRAPAGVQLAGPPARAGCEQKPSSVRQCWTCARAWAERHAQKEHSLCCFAQWGVGGSR